MLPKLGRTPCNSFICSKVSSVAGATYTVREGSALPWPTNLRILDRFLAASCRESAQSVRGSGAGMKIRISIVEILQISFF